jgi:hypothetical protein
MSTSVVAIYDTHEQAEQAVKELQQAGIDMKTLSIAARILIRMSRLSAITMWAIV